MSRSPYVIGQWVRGHRFYGRRSMRERILDGPERAIWVAGLRRVGKTSLLRQLELEIRERGEHALVLDLQGVDGAAELSRAVEDAWLETARPGTTERALELAQDGQPFWLLVDEVDEIPSQPSEPSEPSGPSEPAELASAFASLIADVLAAPDGRVVLGSSPRLIERRDSLHWLARFESPQALGALADDDARALVQQTQAPPAARPTLTPSAVTAICDACGGHPMLLQLVAKRSLDFGDVERALADLERDHTLEHLFAVDHELLTPRQRSLLRHASLGESIETDQDFQRLCELGVLGAHGSIANRLLADWLRRRPVPAKISNLS